MLSPEKLETTLDLMRHFGLNPDPWQLDVLRSEQPRLLLNCARQTGKTTIVAFLGLMEAMLPAARRGSFAAAAGAPEGSRRPGILRNGHRKSPPRRGMLHE